MPWLGWPRSSTPGVLQVVIRILYNAATTVVRAPTIPHGGPAGQFYQAVSSVHCVHAHDSDRRVRHGMGSREALYRRREGVKLDSPQRALSKWIYGLAG